VDAKIRFSRQSGEPARRDGLNGCRNHLEITTAWGENSPIIVFSERYLDLIPETGTIRWRADDRVARIRRRFCCSSTGAALSGSSQPLGDTRGHSPLRGRALRCTMCGTASTSGKRFCPVCGSPLSSRCWKCGAELLLCPYQDRQRALRKGFRGTRDREPLPTAREGGQTRRSTHDAGRHLPVVYRRIRYRGFEGRQNVAR
jgi:hypothetical protein